jgi:RNA polymerase sigma factor (sigma-70 family)
MISVSSEQKSVIQSASLRNGSARIVLMGSRVHKSERFQDLAVPLLGSLYNHAQWLTRDAVEAEDLVQETLTKALRAFESFEHGTNFKAWIFRILRNTFLTSRTAIAYSRTVYLEDHPDVFEAAETNWTPEDEVIKLNDLAALRGALEQLAPHMREVVLLCDLEELKYQEIAVILDLPIGTVMSRLARAREALRKLLISNTGDTYER